MIRIYWETFINQMFAYTDSNFPNFLETKHENLTHCSRTHIFCEGFFVAEIERKSFDLLMLVSFSGSGKRLKINRVATVGKTTLFVCDEEVFNAMVDKEVTASIFTSCEILQDLDDVFEELRLYNTKLCNTKSQLNCSDLLACL